MQESALDFALVEYTDLDSQNDLGKRKKRAM